MVTYLIYSHTNIITGKRYIGQTQKSCQKRWLEHVHNALMLDSNLHFSRAIRKFGVRVWRHDVLQVIDTKIKADECEQSWIERFKSFDRRYGYNMSKGGTGGRLRKESYDKMSASLKNKPKSPEHRRKMSEAAKRYWASASDERRQQVIEKNKSDEGRKASSDAQNRRWSDPKQRQEMSKRHKGKVISAETRKKISEALKNKNR